MKKRTSSAKRYPIWVLLLLILALMTGTAGCGQESSSKPEETTRIVVDCIGRKVEIPDTIQRIGCLYAFAGHITTLLGEEDKIVAVVNGMKRDQLLTSMYPDLLTKPTPFSEDAINMEELAELDPDVVFVRETTAENENTMEQLAALGIPALVVDSNTIEEQRAAVMLVGQVCGGTALEQAKRYDAFFQEAIATAKEKMRNISPEQRITVFHSINEATRTDAAGIMPAEWIALTGAENVSVNEKLNLLDGKSYAGLEQIYRWDPQVIICNEPGVADYILSDVKWKELQAVKTSRVYQMPVAVSRWGHPGSMETPLAIYWLGKLLYPELYSDIDPDEKTKEFYKTFFDYDLSDWQVAMILSGEGMRKEKAE